MSSEIIAAIISLIGILVSAFVSLQLVNWRLQQLETKMDTIDKILREHNQYAEKFAELSGDIKVIATEVQFIKENQNK